VGSPPDTPSSVGDTSGARAPGRLAAGQGETVLRMGLSADPGEVSRVRHLLEDRLTRRGVTVVHDVAVLLTSELVTNAILHGSPPLELHCRSADHTFRVEVHDARRLDTLAARTAAGDAESGRGLLLVDALAARWGWERQGRRKVVWFELDP
jgi:anti-sigma regulatory factor (Ser/Thr protein kinase)